MLLSEKIEKERREVHILPVGKHLKVLIMKIEEKKRE